MAMRVLGAVMNFHVITHKGVVALARNTRASIAKHCQFGRSNI